MGTISLPIEIMSGKNKTLSVYLPEKLIDLLDQIQAERNDPTRSDTVRVLLLTKLAEMSYLPEKEKKAFGIPQEGSEK
ncbi:hypothetical protein AKJ65_02285 [candidate division MSBL1 archaeon SCGC-AAA259E19]|uniref:Ribbon-helix-helix protein CopG domain-containing protein n=2 Tax=candidate division MSBL1 TaxID=215777 RepID=A0A133UGZ6_9EURY|nr:hypothetical protein AKJ66_01940 [candidate division MSBL1 archaeon SCGC-AAA259E22]KXA95204.1 hypothetical protein AKJ65_02285 [candidate division MSBL1 archaeon SCGC-AAA259E19]